MAIEIKLPELGDGIESGDVLEVYVKEGDQITARQSILELETDKATVEVPCSDAGVITKIHVQVGQTVKIGETLISVDPSSGGGPAAAPSTEATREPAPPPAAPPAAPPPAATPPAASAPPPPAPTPTASVSAAPAAPTTPPTAPVAAAPPMSEAPTASPTMATPRSGGPIPAGPAIRRFAREVGVDLSSVAGSGPGGRITREDVLQVVRNANAAASSGSSATATVVTPDNDLPGTPSNDLWGPVNVESAPRIRKAIANQMFESWTTVPRVTNFDDADVTELERMRQASKADYAASGIKLTSMPFLIKAVSMALRNHPLVNASYDMEKGEIIYKRYINVGIAVDTERGLVVPALRNTDQKSISEIARELATMAGHVRSNNFSLEDIRGGTFTISNLGAIGGTYSTPIINVPEVAILLVGRSRKMPVVVDDEVVVRLMMPLSLSYDHRLVDGATAARFLNEVIGYLQAPGRLLLAP